MVRGQGEVACERFSELDEDVVGIVFGSGLLASVLSGFDDEVGGPYHGVDGREEEKEREGHERADSSVKINRLGRTEFISGSDRMIPFEELKSFY